MRTLFYDPCGFGGLNFLNQFSDAIINAPITPNQNDQLQRLKERIVQFIDLHNPLRERIKSERARFEFCVLLPAAECTYIHNEYEFKSDMHMLDHVMKQIPPHIGVFLTVHDGDVVLTRPVIEYFQSKYPNLLFISPIAKHVYAYSHSLYFFNDVDAIINPISGTGILSLFWDKKIISIANRYNSWFEDTQGLDGLENVLRQPIVNKNNRLHWYLTHYAVFENDFLKPGWLAQYFQSKYDRYQAKGINADYFEPLQDIDTVSQYIISSLDHYGLTSARKKEKNWWQKIMGNLPTKSIG